MSRCDQRVWLLSMLVVASLASACARQPASASVGGDWQMEGPVQVIDGQTWVVGTQLVTVPPNAAVAGEPVTGSIVRLVGRRGDDGEFVVQQVQVVQNDAQSTQPTPSPTSIQGTSVPTPTKVPEATVQPTAQPQVRVPPAPVRAPARREEDDESDDD